MVQGSSWAKANVDVGGRVYKAVSAVIYDGEAVLKMLDGTVVARMANATVESYDGSTAMWTNGTDTWLVSKAGCGCRGD